MRALRRTATVLRAILAALVLLVLVAGVPLLLVSTVGSPIPDDWSWNSPLTNDALLGVLAGVSWIIWAQLLVCVLIEIVAEIRIATGRSADWLSRIPGTFSGQQLLARTLVQAVVAVGLTSTAASAAVPVWPAHAEVSAAPTPDREPAPTPHPGPAMHVESRPTAPMSRTTRESYPTTVVVAKGDTLWSIAEAHLGSGERWREIAELNEGRVMSAGSRFHDSGTVLPGWELLLPAPAKDEDEDEVVTVRRGDSLWQIAEDEYGDGAEWPRIYAANRDVVDDPDEIFPGQSLHVPGAAATRVPTKQAPQTQPVDPGDPTGKPPGTGHQVPEEPTVEPTPQPTTAEPVLPPVGEDIQAQPEGPAEPEDTVPSTLVDQATIARALLGGGGLLAAGMLAVYAGRRLTQARNRRSGRVAPHVAPQLGAEEKALRAVGSSAGRSAAFFDAALRELAQLAETRGIPLPEAAAARIDADRLELHLAEAAAVAPDPWLVSPDGSVWSVPSTHQPHVTDRLSPYPAMVTLGDDDRGGTWFVDLEAAGVVQVTGDRQTAADVVRFVTAELALNPWMDADIVRVTGIAGELAPLNHGRLYPDDQPHVEELVKVARRMTDCADGSQRTVLESRVLDGGADAWVPQVVVADIGDAAGAALAAETRELLDEIERSAGRTPAALVCLTAESLDRRAVTLTAHTDGSLVAPWAVLRANGISAVEVSVLTAMFDDAETEGDEPIPAVTGAHGEPGDTDLAGALVSDLTEQRCGTGDPRSVLPRPDPHYLESAATTAQDLQTLAPAVPPSETVRAMVADSSLDADLGEWLDPASTRPKLRVLGPIELHAAGEKSKEVESRPAYFAELAAYLSCHPEGVTPSRAAADFGLQHNSLHTRLGSLRKWLGTRDGSDEWYLPEARRVRGQAVYRVEGLLCDADLFRRLRARGEARGPEGIEDLHRALELVAGSPFDQQRATGYGWLVDTPVDQYLTAGVVDVAHVVATHALAEGTPSVALWAAERAIAAAPSEDKPRLDLARARQAMGEDAEAERYLRHEVFNRSDDDRAPLDPSDRTRAVVDGFSGRRGGT
jgi:nucleoid-associated protein YgaU